MWKFWGMFGPELQMSAKNVHTSENVYTMFHFSYVNMLFPDLISALLGHNQLKAWSVIYFFETKMCDVVITNY